MPSKELLLPLAIETASKAIGNIQQVQAQSRLARYQADIARQQADYERQVAAADADQTRRDTDLALGSRIASLAAAGVDPASTSALLAQQDLASQGELQALRLRNGGAVRAASLDRSADLALRRARSFSGTALLNGFVGS